MASDPTPSSGDARHPTPAEISEYGRLLAAVRADRSDENVKKLVDFMAKTGFANEAPVDPDEPPAPTVPPPAAS